MNTRFYNAKILTMNGTPQISVGELWVSGDIITHIGTAEKTDNINFDREIDVCGNLLMPGFKNAHTHSAMTFLRSHADDLPLEKWLYKKVFPLEAKLTAEDIYAFTKLAILEYIAGGTTAAFDMYFEPEAVASACREMGFRLVFCGAVNNFKESVEKLEGYYKAYNTYHPLISYKLGFHAEYTTSVQIMRDISALAKREKAAVYVHSSETENEVAGCIERYGKTPTELFDSLGLFDFGGGSFHSVHLSDNDIEILQRKNVFAITNPASNLKLASGIAPLQRLIDNGVRVAIGTDGPASNNCLSIWREMYLATVLQKYLNKNAAALPAENILTAATVNGACAMGLSECDVLAKGKQADLIMIDLHRPNMQPINNIVKNLVYSGSEGNVILTMIAGKILYENGEFFVGQSAEDIYETANKLTSKIISERQ